MGKKNIESWIGALQGRSMERPCSNGRFMERPYTEGKLAASNNAATNS